MDLGSRRDPERFLHHCVPVLPASSLHPQIPGLRKGELRFAGTEGGGLAGPAWGGLWSGEGHNLEAKHCCPDNPIGIPISDNNVYIFNSLIQQVFIHTICQDLGIP